MRLRAEPQSLFTWNYQVFQNDQMVATTHYTIWGESGQVSVGSNVWSVERQGPMSGEWWLSKAGTQPPVAIAHKPSVLARKFEVRWGESHSLVLEAEHLFTRRMQVVAMGTLIGHIAPKHPFTRHATLEFPDEVPMELRLFCLWLAALLWRRASSNNNSS